MKCEKCKVNEATTHIRREINGVKSEYHLCSECAKNSDIIIRSQRRRILGWEIYSQHFSEISPARIPNRRYSKLRTYVRSAA